MIFSKLAFVAILLFVAQAHKTITIHHDNNQPDQIYTVELSFDSKSLYLHVNSEDSTALSNAFIIGLYQNGTVMTGIPSYRVQGTGTYSVKYQIDEEFLNRTAGVITLSHPFWKRYHLFSIQFDLRGRDQSSFTSVELQVNATLLNGFVAAELTTRSRNGSPVSFTSKLARCQEKRKRMNQPLYYQAESCASESPSFKLSTGGVFLKKSPVEFTSFRPNYQQAVSRPKPILKWVHVQLPYRRSSISMEYYPVSYLFDDCFTINMTMVNFLSSENGYRAQITLVFERPNGGFLLQPVSTAGRVYAPPTTSVGVPTISTIDPNVVAYPGNVPRPTIPVYPWVNPQPYPMPMPPPPPPPNYQRHYHQHEEEREHVCPGAIIFLILIAASLVGCGFCLGRWSGRRSGRCCQRRQRQPEVTYNMPQMPVGIHVPTTHVSQPFEFQVLNNTASSR